MPPNAVGCWVSKAFTKEDDGGQPPLVARLQSPLRSGERNYLTPAGAQKLRDELEQLAKVKRPSLLAVARTDDQAKQQLAVLDQRLAYLEESLRTAEVQPAPVGEENRVRFGASVTVKENSGATTTYRLVGVDETDLDRNWVSWQSPVARALLNRQLGEHVTFTFPAGKSELEITKIEYS